MEERFGVLPKSDDFGFTGAEKSVTLTTNFLTWNLEYGNVGPPPQICPQAWGTESSLSLLYNRQFMVKKAGQLPTSKAE
jgi:hypothetical protein